MPSSDRGLSDEAASDPAQGQVPPATNPEQTRTLLAESLASASDDALAQVKPETLERIAEALEQTPGKPDASNGGTSTGSSTADSNTNEVQITALTPPPPPTALPPSSEAPSASASVKPQPPAAEQPPASRKRVLDAPATDLAAVPVLLLAKALSDIDTARLSADEPVPLPSAITAARQEIKLDADARRFVAELTRPSLRPIKIAQADHFVSADQRLDLGLKALPPVKTLDELLAEGGDDDRPVTRVRITHRLEPIQPADLLVQATRSPGAPIRILEQEQITEIPLSEALRRHRLQPSAPIVSVREVQVLEPTTLGELKALAKVKPEELPRVIAGTPGATYRTVEELLGLADRESDSLYYVRTVQPDDVQGIWGIIQSGLIDNFARGMAIARGDQVNTYRVHIPRLADEPLADNSGSSFLGRMIFRKMRRSTIYNIKLGRIATTPENIRPGQQIIIVDFTPEELIAIYRHFARTAS